jgi:isoleucyl-tRNA synthetase
MWWRVLAEDFVTLDTGTGIVHIAPAFGEDDHKAHGRQLGRYAHPEEVELICAVDPDGTFRAEAGRYAGRWVKDCDREIIAELRAADLLLHDELYRHDYPFCWRAEEDPLIQMARPAWFIRTTARLGDALKNNQAVNWLPEHIKTGRFGDFLEHNVDWALSRERYWGTPLNVWKCPGCGALSAPASVAEIERRNPQAFAGWYRAKREDPTLSEHLIVHKPWIDEVVLPCRACGAEMRRVPEVIDCWFDSGCMPFAQWGFPHAPGSRERFFSAFPADFISEAIDQTRGWFYSLLMISSLVFDRETQSRLGLEPLRDFPHPYRTCIVLGLVCDREGKKESKSRGNYTPPDLILERVRMDFGVLDELPRVTARPGEALVAAEDLEGMDLTDGAEVAVYRPDRPDTRLRLRVRPQPKLPRRLVVLDPEARGALGVAPIRTRLETMPVEVPRAPLGERVTLEDETTPAPGADAFRWFFYASSPPSTNTRHSLRNVRTLQRDFQVKLRNVYSFFVIYANIDGWRPELRAGAPPPAERPVLDRWMLSELALAVGDVRAALDGYLVYEAAARLVGLVEGLSNWYVRRSRSRFWAAGLEADKLAAYATLYHALTTIVRLAAPFIPFLTEEMYQNLVLGAGVDGPASVHLTDYPEVDASAIDQRLAEDMAAVREIVSLGLSVRTHNKLKVRQPLDRADVVFNDAELPARMAAYREPMREELNVHELGFMYPGHDRGAVTFRIKPNFRALGPRLGKRVQAVKRLLEAADGARLHHELNQQGRLRLELEGEPLDLSPDEVEVVVEAAPGFAAETGKVGVIVLHTTLTEELIDEGILREVISRIQTTRKELSLGFTDRIVLTLGGTERVLGVCRAELGHIAGECLASRVEFGESASAKEHRLGDDLLRLAVEKA